MGEVVPRRIVIVDDIELTVTYLTKLINLDARFQVVGTAMTAADGLAVALETKPDLVLMDILMPGMGAYEAIAAIREALPGTRVIVMSILGDAKDLRAAMIAGAIEFLLKPFSQDELYAALATW